MRKYTRHTVRRLSSRGTHHFVLVVNTSSLLQELSDDLNMSLSRCLLEGGMAALKIEL